MERWPPMESNPEVLNQFAAQIGLDTEKYQFGDVWGLDPELLAFVPQPVHAMILLFPSSAKVPFVEGTTVLGDEAKVFYLKQVDALDDACGTIAMVHALANNIESLELAEDSLLVKYVKGTQGSAQDKGVGLVNNEGIKGLHSHHSQQGDTSPINESGQSGHHFVCFIDVDGELYELDGCKPGPINHGPIEQSFLLSTGETIQRVYMTNPDVVDFSMISLHTVGQ
eukprot:TRINITY_DN10709_c0_g1_i1.p1 TRINITY_DN10709_c0_g1~~TRINITY_DN10709_c0_g1_i1.p1  ORF type:complete len:233 (-),score=56.39 TRINITY_DN10709_c0_g1_i1:14-688(-)